MPTPIETIPVLNRISVKLALVGLLVALVVGLSVSLLQVSLDLRSQQRAVNSIVNGILTAAGPPAHRAVLTLDASLAQEVVSGLISYRFVSNAVIQDELGNNLANVSRPRRSTSTSWLTRLLTEEYRRFNVELSVPEKPPEQSGKLALTVDMNLALSPLYERGLVSLSAGLLRNILLTLLLFGAFYFMLTKPLLGIIAGWTQVPADNPKPPPIGLLKSHRDDELGLLWRTGNRFIETIARRVGELETTNSALALNEQRFRDYAAAASDWFWEQDADFRFVDTGQDTATELTPTPIRDWVGMTLWEAVRPDRSDTRWVALSKSLRAQEEFRKFRFDYIVPGEPPRTLEISGVPYFDASGDFKGYRGVISDITEIVVAEEKLAHAAKLESLGRLTGGIAHDFNNLLAIIQGNLDLFVEDLPKEQLPRERLRAAMEATQRGSELTQQLLAIARRQFLVARPINLNRIILRTDQMLRRLLESSIQIRINLADDLWTCKVDVSRMENVLINLALNSRDAMPESGLLTIETENITIDPNQIAGLGQEVVPGEYVRLTVSDTGIGMSAEVQKRIFEPFYTTKAHGSGTGLGLSQIHGFVKQSGGYISVFSEPNNGTTFRMYLPRCYEAAVELSGEPVERTTLPAKEEKVRVMIVEDNPDLRELTRSAVESLGYATLEFANGEEALAAAERGEVVDLLISDIILTGAMTGHDVGVGLSRRFPNLGIIYMSGYPERALNAMEGDMSDITMLQKPFRRRDLTEAITRKLTECRARAAEPVES